tara:strand:- start:13 stop:378 length:366 start_codon:yes stop_codon:yes gene_type:complete
VKRYTKQVSTKKSSFAPWAWKVALPLVIGVAWLVDFSVTKKEEGKRAAEAKAEAEAEAEALMRGRFLQSKGRAHKVEAFRKAQELELKRWRESKRPLSLEAQQLQEQRKTNRLLEDIKNRR